MPGRNYALKMHEVKQAAQMYQDGLSRRQIADHFGVTDMAIRNALRLAGVRMRTMRDAILIRNVWNRVNRPLPTSEA